MTLRQPFTSYKALWGVLAAVACVQAQEVRPPGEPIASSQPEQRGATATATAPAREIDPQADRVLKEMCTLLDGCRTIRFRVSAVIDRPLATGQLAQFHRTSEVTVARPDRMYAKTESDDGKWLAFYRGNTLTVFDRDDNTYASETVPTRLVEMLDYMAGKYDLVMPMADLLVGETYGSLLADVDSGVYIGLHSVGDTKCHHLLFRQANLDWQIWIDAGNRPLPRKLVITYTQRPGEPQFVATIDGWDLNPAVSDETFAFKAPAGAKDVAMSDLVAER